uniref:Transposase (Putative), gypsy type n=1 Tax=Tanacetum cinerariifolium TaxID=118510 RepID=A0A699I3T8_TANCI|nr:hypothetical protein [Tanacetum cinerariifolium]
MGRDIVQLETAVSTISQEYLLEFTSEYGISENLHPELPGPEERIVDFSEGKVDIDLFNFIRAPNPTKVKTGTRPRAAHEVPLLTVIASQIIEMEDPVATTDSSGVPSTIERSPLDFANENPSQQSTGGNGTEDQCQEAVAPEVPPPEKVMTTRVAPEAGQAEEIAATGPRVVKERRKRGNDGVDTNAPPKVLRRDHVDPRLTQSTIGGKSLAAMGLGMGSTCLVPTSRDTHVDVSDPDLLSLANPQSIPTANVAQSSKGAAVAGDPKSENTSFTSMVGSPESIYRPEWGVTNGCRLDAPEACQDLVDPIAPPGAASGDGVAAAVKARENEIKNLEAMLEAETDMKKTAKAKNGELDKELETLRALFSDLQVSNDRLSQQVSTLQAQVIGEEKLKAAFEEFKQYGDNRVEKRCAEIDARLDALSIDFDEELYPHMLTAIACRRWVIGHGLCLAGMKCGESTELRQVFADVVSAGIAKDMSEGLKMGDLKYPMVDQLESLKDAPIDVIMASLHLESDTGNDAPQWISELRHSSSQLKILVYPEVSDPKDPWACKEEILLADAIAANVSRAEKKKKCRVVCHTHGVGSAHHAKSDGVPVSVPTVAPQGLAILLMDAATQTETFGDGASPRLLRSSSLPAKHNLC